MATCAEIRAQLAALMQQMEEKNADLINADAEIKDDPAHKDFWEAQKAKLDAELKTIKSQIEDLRSPFEAQCIEKQPQHILEIQFANPNQVQDVDTLYAQTVALGRPDPSLVLGGTFPSLDAKQEWKQTLPADLIDTAAHEVDYEGVNLVGATGWVLNPGFSGADVPFDHPFGFDWEFLFALDQPDDDPNRYTFLLTPADQSCDEEGFPEATQQASSFTRQQSADPNPIPDLVNIPLGPDSLPNLLGVEIDGDLVPQQFTDWRRGGVVQGDRIAVFGRWIVDCGHQLPIKSCTGDDKHLGMKAFRTEIHPPLLMAAARVTTGSLLAPSSLNAPTLTRVLFTSRPYLVSQRFTTDTNTIYNDTAPDDGPFVSHMIEEVWKVNTLRSLQVEAHPKIKSFPFQGSYELHLTVRPPPPIPGQVTAPGQLRVSFQFTVRSGCTVNVITSGPDSIDVVIGLHQADYRPPALPQRHERTWSRGELGQLNMDAAKAYLDGELISAGIEFLGLGVIGAAVVAEILGQGIVTDEYETSAMRAINMLDASHAVSAPANNIPSTDIQTRLDELLKQRDQLASEVQGDKGDLAELQSEAKHVNPIILAKAKAKLAADVAKLKQINDQIAALSNAVGLGVVQNDNQPYPVYGWLEVGYAPLHQG